MKKSTVTVVAHKPSERKEAIIKLFIIVFCGAILWLWSILAGALTVLNWLSALVLGRRNPWIAEFLELYNSFTYSALRYVAGVTNERPFPFTKLTRISEFKA